MSYSFIKSKSKANKISGIFELPYLEVSWLVLIGCRRTPPSDPRGAYAYLFASRSTKEMVIKVKIKSWSMRRMVIPLEEDLREEGSGLKKGL